MTCTLYARIGALTAGCLALAAAATARAGITAVGDPFNSGSWTQAFNESGVGNFDHIQMFMLSGPSFEQPTAVLNFTVGGWSQTYNDGTTVVGDGPGTTNMNFAIVFSGALSDPLSFVFQAFNGYTNVENVAANWSGSAWSFGASSYPTDYVTPAPGSLALLGLGGIVGLRRRR